MQILHPHAWQLHGWWKAEVNWLRCELCKVPLHYSNGRRCMMLACLLARAGLVFCWLLCRSTALCTRATIPSEAARKQRAHKSCSPTESPSVLHSHQSQ